MYDAANKEETCVDKGLLANIFLASQDIFKNYVHRYVTHGNKNETVITLWVFQPAKKIGS